MALTHPDESSPVRVDVTRTGGIAGVARAWTAEPSEGEASDWTMLIERCPWDAPAAEATGADRYTWEIAAVCGPDERRTELPDSDLVGAWRELVDAVRDWAGRPGTRPDQASAR